MQNKSLSGLFVLGLLGFLGISAIAYPVYDYYQTPRAISAMFVDTSSSNQRFAELIKLVCKARLDQLKDGDIRIDGKFAEQTDIPKNELYTDSQHLRLQQECEQAATQSINIGNRKGTDLNLVLKSMHTEIQKNKQLRLHAVGIIVINAAEPVKGQSAFEPQQFKTEVQELVKDGTLLVLLVSDRELYQQLSDSLLDLSNKVWVRTYEDSRKTIEDVHTLARKKF